MWHSDASDALPPEHCEPRSSCPNMNSCFNRGNTPRQIASAIHMAGVAVLNHSGGKDWMPEYSFLSLIISSVAVALCY